ncbi:MAG: tetratricopeptide repeat protein [Proteobacteria bacterium]|uniref:tetratricopeptide repeat protein n=1 Tax=Rudaea sp. TaxID=2136325 RepID=UPI001D32D578|nr:tetratricopeptide repeat protein [Pseudomonadota bacterium]MBS0567732.1 tetratricopeptide repeat protein [Pseudomonadota bacterium]
MSTPNPAIIQSMQRASALLQAGNFVAARSLLEQVVQAAPGFVEGYRLLAGAQLALGDSNVAERSLRHAVAIDPDWAPAQAALGELLIGSGRGDEGERALRRAVAHAHRYPRALYLLACLLNESNRHAEVADLTATLADDARADPDLLQQRAIALAKLARLDEAIAIQQRLVAMAPDNATVELLLAGTLDTAGRHREAERHARSAIGKGASSAEAHYLHARTLIATDRADEAETLLRNVVAAQPLFADAQTNLAQLIWMRTGDAEAAGEHIDRALRRHPDDSALAIARTNLLAGSGDAGAALAAIEARAASASADLLVLACASQAALQSGDGARALSYALRAVRLAPAEPLSNHSLIEALLATGDADAARHRAEALLRTHPDDQFLIAAQTTAWRLLGDPRYVAYCDYAGMARAWPLDTPRGWRDLPAYLADLATSLKRLHTMRAHPLHQTLRHGSQTAQNLLDVDDAPIRAFFGAIDAPIRRHIEAIGRGDDPLRRRNNGAYRIAGIWSVRLNAQGFHTNHVHPQGWLSSACYIELPRAVAGDNPGREGFLKFGEPGYPTQPGLEPEYFIRPEPGLLALFPSYFWHGTVPFGGDDTRLTIAFDLVPA